MFQVNTKRMWVGGQVTDKVSFRRGKTHCQIMALALIDVCTFGKLFKCYDLDSASVNLYQSCFGINTFIKKVKVKRLENDNTYSNKHN